MLNTLILLMFVESFGAMQTEAISCDFPGLDVAERSIHVVLAPRPSLKDQPGLYRVMMEMNGQVTLRAAARPIHSTDDRDVLIRSVVGQRSVYSIGLRDDGKAALNMQTRRSGETEIDKSTRIGECYGYERFINRWLPS